MAKLEKITKAEANRRFLQEVKVDIIGEGGLMLLSGGSGAGAYLAFAQEEYLAGAILGLASPMLLGAGLESGRKLYHKVKDFVANPTQYVQDQYHAELI